MQIGTKQETVIRRVVATHRVRFDVRRFKDVFGFPSTDSASSVVQMQQSFPERRLAASQSNCSGRSGHWIIVDRISGTVISIFR
jgi:hypothetical protein